MLCVALQCRPFQLDEGLSGLLTMTGGCNTFSGVVF